ncbi:jg22082 [Pararge aegeria aegeria]|uniref:Jg22082 protein n=1 Tax=Pararge aegeria aegeria TaxID=348720 RepID=A0A8S4RKU6_9NEOP|nr:jg22082 [Pararge aegeria aegeria]
MTYGFETWSLTMGLIRRLKVTQRAIERATLGVSLRLDEIRNEEMFTTQTLSSCGNRTHGLGSESRVAAHSANRPSIEEMRRSVEELELPT